MNLRLILQVNESDQNDFVKNSSTEECNGVDLWLWRITLHLDCAKQLPHLITLVTRCVSNCHSTKRYHRQMLHQKRYPLQNQIKQAFENHLWQRWEETRILGYCRWTGRRLMKAGCLAPIWPVPWSFSSLRTSTSQVRVAQHLSSRR